MKRRGVCLGLLALGVGGCRSLSGGDLRVMALSGCLSADLLQRFERDTQLSATLQPAGDPDKLWRALQDTTLPPQRRPDIFSLSDAWLDRAIAKDLLRLIPEATIAKMEAWAQLDPRWRESATREGQVWGIPFRWGMTAIAYRRDKIKFEIADWADLWHPKLKGRVTLLNSPRETIGLVLKKLGHSYSTPDLDAIATLEGELRQLHAQALIYTSDNYLKPLLTGDSWAAVGWSSDLRQARRQDPNIAIATPASGTALWTDLWVLPKSHRGNRAAAIEQWLTYWLQPAIALQIGILTNAAPTVPVWEQLPKGIRRDPSKFPSDEALQRSEILLPLAADTARQYDRLWRTVRDRAPNAAARDEGATLTFPA